MTPREIIEKVVTFQSPPRIGMTFSRDRQNDVVSGGIGRDPNFDDKRHVKDNVEYWYDVWGNLWHRIVGMSAGGEVAEPVLKDWADLDTLVLPDFSDPARYQAARKNHADHPDLFPVGGLPAFPFNTMRYMRKVEVFLADVLLYPDHVMALQRRMVDLIKDSILQWSHTEAKALMFCEDWGTQERLLINPELWRKMFRPGFEEIVGFANDHGLQVWMHSCGYIYDIMDDLIGVGMQVLQLDQPDLVGVEKLGREFGGRVTFWSPVDIQKTLQTGDHDTIRDAARRMVEHLGGAGGGFIAKNYGDLHGIGVPEQWDDWAYEAFVEFGTY